MLNKYLYIILFLLLPQQLLLPKETIKAEVEKENVKIYNSDLSSQCCSEFSVEVQIKDKLITITERDTLLVKCRCMCNFDLETGISQLRPGVYTASIYREELKKYNYSYDTTYFIGDVNFEIITVLAMPPNSITFNQSQCHDTIDISNVSEDSGNKSLSFSNPYIDDLNQLHINTTENFLRINFYNLIGNCTSTFDIQLTGNDISVINLNSLTKSDFLYKILFYNYSNNEINILNI
jgi:hypothetical protein